MTAPFALRTRGRVRAQLHTQVAPAQRELPGARTREGSALMPRANDTRAVPVRTGVRTQPRRYDLQPLLDRIGGSGRSAARQLGISGSTEQEYRKRGVTERVADRLAAKVGLVAYEVWPEMADHAIADASRRCARAKCGEAFVPARESQVYCSAKCRQRESARRHAARRYRNDPDYAARQRAASRDYYDQYGSYVRAQARRRRAVQRATGEAAA